MCAWLLFLQFRFLQGTLLNETLLADAFLN